MNKINFFYEGIDIKINKKEIRKWIENIILEENFSLKTLNYIFCDDDYLLEINLQYLNHDTLTDIITFDNSESPFEIEGDIFISIPRVMENASIIGIDAKEEIKRVIVHGILHLLGFKDKTSSEEQTMRSKEDYYLLKLNVPRGTY